MVLVLIFWLTCAEDEDDGVGTGHGITDKW